MTVARREHFGYLLEPQHHKIFYEVYNQIPSKIATLFKVEKTSNPYETEVSIGTMGEFPEFQGTVEYDRPYQQYRRVVEFPEYAKGYRIERKMWDDDRYNEMNKQPAGLAISAARRRESHAASIFNNAFSTTKSIDGQILCSDDHTSEAPDGPAAGHVGRTNVGTLPLNHKNLQITKNLMRGFIDDRGGKIAINPDTLLVPVGLEEMAWELNQSEKKIETADNDPNIHKGKYNLIVWDELEDNGNWFLIDSTYMKMFLTWFDRVPLEFAMEEDFDTLVAKFRAYMRYAASVSDWVWIFGNDVS